MATVTVMQVLGIEDREGTSRMTVTVRSSPQWCRAGRRGTYSSG